MALRVLVVEADGDLNAIMCDALREAGYDAVPCAPEKAAAQAAGLPDGVIVAALSSAALEDAPLYRELRANPKTRDFALVLITGRGEMTIRRRLGERPPCVLFKPFAPEQLVEAVGQVLADRAS